MIQPVNETNIETAAEIHAFTWRESHRSFCTEEFVAVHTAQRQRAYLERRIADGADVYLLNVDGKSVGIVSVLGDLIGDLYVLPEEQRKGYGTTLLRFAMEKCEGTPKLWVLDNNREAIRLYRRCGFCMTGERKELTETLAELEMKME